MRPFYNSSLDFLIAVPTKPHNEADTPDNSGRQDGQYRNYVPFGPNLVQWQSAMSTYMGRHMVGVGIPTNAVIIGPPAHQASLQASWDTGGVVQRSFFMQLPTKTNQYFNMKEQQMIPSQPSDSQQSNNKFYSMVIALSAAIKKLGG